MQSRACRRNLTRLNCEKRLNLKVMNEFVMKDFGFTALDPVARCAISGGDSEYGILGELLEDLLEGLASKLGAAGILVSMLAKNIDSFIDGFRAGWNKNK
jgi:hypothetical protein